MGGINTVDGRVYDDNGQSPDIFQVSIRQNQIWSDRFAIRTLSMEKSLSLQKEKSMSGQLHSL